MAGELKNALDQIKADVATLANVQRATLGQPLTAIPETTESKCTAAVYMMSGGPLNDAYASTSEKHRIEIRFYWLLTPGNVEIVEQSMATMWDVVMTKFFGSDADRNLSDKVTLAQVGGEGGRDPYATGYESISERLHRVLIVAVEVTLDTHSV